MLHTEGWTRENECLRQRIEPAEDSVDLATIDNRPSVLFDHAGSALVIIGGQRLCHGFNFQPMLFEPHAGAAVQCCHMCSTGPPGQAAAQYLSEQRMIAIPVSIVV